MSYEKKMELNKILEIIICDKRERMITKYPEVLILFKRKARD